MLRKDEPKHSGSLPVLGELHTNFMINEVVAGVYDGFKRLVIWRIQWHLRSGHYSVERATPVSAPVDAGLTAYVRRPRIAMTR